MKLDQLAMVMLSVLYISVLFKHISFFGNKMSPRLGFKFPAIRSIDMVTVSASLSLYINLLHGAVSLRSE